MLKVARLFTSDATYHDVKGIYSIHAQYLNVEN